MFEQLFSLRSAIARHESAPFANERTAFLRHLAQQSYPPRSLRAKASQLLAIVQQLHRVRDLGLAQIEYAANKRRHLARLDRRTRPGNLCRAAFRHTATTWLQYLGWLSVAPVEVSKERTKLNQFEVFLREERGLSPHTIRRCCSHASRLLTHLQTLKRPLRKITAEDLDALIFGLTASGWKRSSLPPVVDAVRSFLRYAEAKRWCPLGVSFAVSAPRAYVDDRLPRGLDWEVVTKLIDHASSNSPRDLRDRPILLLLAVYGLRCSEVAAIRLDDIDWDNSTIQIRRSKQRLSQLYPLHADIGDAIARYLRHARPHSKSRHVFLHLLAPFGNLGHPSIYYAVSNRLKALGVHGRRQGPHALRHACAQRLLESGLTFKHVGDFLGHRSTAATRIYAKVNLKALTEVAQIDMRGIL
jgi:site-specific recombinase XerD